MNKRTPCHNGEILIVYSMAPLISLKGFTVKSAIKKTKFSNRANGRGITHFGDTLMIKGRLRTEEICVITVILIAVQTRSVLN